MPMVSGVLQKTRSCRTSARDASRWETIGTSEGIMSRRRRRLRGEVPPQDRLFDARATAIRSRKSQDEQESACLGQLDGNTRFRGWCFKQVLLFKEFHLTTGFLHKWRAFGLSCLQQPPFGFLPLFPGCEWHGQCVQSVLLVWIFFDQGTGEQQAVWKHRQSAGIQM